MVSVSGREKPARDFDRVRLPVPSRSRLPELLLFFGGFWFIDNYVVTSGSLLDFRPHPFWIPVLLLALQYGIVDGLLAAAAAVFTLYLIAWPQPSVGEDYFAFWLRAWLEPSLWVGTALVLGGIRQSQIHMRAELLNDLAHAQRKAMVLSDMCLQLRGKIGQLERRIAGGGLVPPEALVAIVDFYSSTPRDFAEKLSRTVRAALGDVDYSLTVGREQLLLSLRSGGNPTVTATRPSDQIQTVIDELSKHHRILGIHNLDDGCLEGIDAVFAGAIAFPGRDDVVGVLAIHRVNDETAAGEIESHIGPLCHAIGSVVGGLWREIAAEPSHEMTVIGEVVRPEQSSKEASNAFPSLPISLRA